MNGPRPSTHAFLSDLSCLPTDSKIRFLGCVRRYNISTGHLVLEHNYPRRKAEPPSAVAVDINAVLEDLTADELRVGAWLNVLGYVRDETPVSSFSSPTVEDDATATTTTKATTTATSNATSSSRADMNETPTAPMLHRVRPRPVYVEAVMVFSAGAIALGEYERILRDVQDVERRVRLVDS